MTDVVKFFFVRFLFEIEIYSNVPLLKSYVYS